MVNRAGSTKAVVIGRIKTVKRKFRELILCCVWNRSAMSKEE